MSTIRKSARLFTATGIAMLVSACGGGGGSDEGGGNVPPPTAARSYSVQLVDAGLEDSLTGLDVEASGLPVSGATATRD